MTTDMNMTLYIKSLTAEWLGRPSQEYEMYCHYLEVMGSNSSRVDLEVRSPSVLSGT